MQCSQNYTLVSVKENTHRQLQCIPLGEIDGDTFGNCPVKFSVLIVRNVFISYLKESTRLESRRENRLD